MDYEKAYKEALEKAKGIINYYKEHNRGDEASIEDLEIIFPELKESEDERIRKGIIDFLWKEKIFLQEAHSSVENNPKYRFVMDAIAWLEKQKSVEQNDTTDSQHKSALEAWKGMRLEVYAQASGNRHEPNVSDDCTKMFSLNDIDVIIENIENEIKKPKYSTLNIIPKFKVGDFIANDYCRGMVVELTNDAYLLDTGQGIPFSYEHNAHLWTIQDAKDGDVLYSLDSKQPFIFKHRKPNEQAAVYCGINIYGKFFVGDTKDCVITTDKYIPADKSQCDILFKEMQEAGYEWDAEKKELKLLISNGSDFESNNSKQKPTWSEEDEKIITALMEGFRYHQLFNPTFGEVPNAEIISWLKSLKERLS